MGMVPEETNRIGDELAVRYKDCSPSDSRFTTSGYDDFRCSAVFGKDGCIVMANIDAHLGNSSKHEILINKKFFSK